MQRQRVSFVAFLLCRLRISAQNKPVRSKRLFVGFTEYFKTPAYCSCSETMAHLKVPVAASSFNWLLSGERCRCCEIIYIRQSQNYEMEILPQSRCQKNLGRFLSYAFLPKCEASRTVKFNICGVTEVNAPVVIWEIHPADTKPGCWCLNQEERRSCGKVDWDQLRC